MNDGVRVKVTDIRIVLLVPIRTHTTHTNHTHCFVARKNDFDLNAAKNQDSISVHLHFADQTDSAYRIVSATRSVIKLCIFRL